ncbi:hypothetical protein AK821_11390 [Pseudomonas sp. RIT-PI-r]|nr:hypothetical protein AK821_11390 [Pseudomonas sp. RIT-PI-r]
MTKGPGRSDCCRVGVTYGYRECLRKGRVRAIKKLRRRFADPASIDGLALSFQSSKTLIQSVQLILFIADTARKNITRCFMATVYRQRVHLNSGTSSLPT